jgi:hypothetical protein
VEADAVSVVSSQVVWGYINGIQLAMLVLFIDRTSLIDIEVRLKALAYVFIKYFYKLSLIGVKEKFSKERGTVCSHRNVNNLLKNVPLNSSIMLSISNSNIQLTSVSVYHFLPFLSCLTK